MEISEVGAIIVMYLPTVLAVITVLFNCIKTINSFKKIDLTSHIQKFNASNKTLIVDLESQINDLTVKNAELINNMKDEFKQEIAAIKSELEEYKTLLKAQIEENVKLTAELRRKTGE